MDSVVLFLKFRQRITNKWGNSQYNLHDDNVNILQILNNSKFKDLDDQV